MSALLFYTSLFDCLHFQSDHHRHSLSTPHIYLTYQCFPISLSTLSKAIDAPISLTTGRGPLTSQVEHTILSALAD